MITVREVSPFAQRLVWSMLLCFPSPSTSLLSLLMIFLQVAPTDGDHSLYIFAPGFLYHISPIILHPSLSTLLTKPKDPLFEKPCPNDEDPDLFVFQPWQRIPLALRPSPLGLAPPSRGGTTAL